MATAGRHTKGSQFFCCGADLYSGFPTGNTPFGQGTQGSDVGDQIGGAPRNSRDMPDSPVAMTKVTITEE